MWYVRRRWNTLGSLVALIVCRHGVFLSRDIVPALYDKQATVVLIRVTSAQENCTRRLVQVSQVCHDFCTSFFLAPNRMQLYSVQETCMHVAKIARFDWSSVSSLLLSAMFVVKVSCTRTCIIFGLEKLGQVCCTIFLSMCHCCKWQCSYVTVSDMLTG